MMQVSKLTAIVVSLLFASSVGRAQNWQYGVKVDLNYSTAIGNGLANKMNIGYSIGGWANYAITKRFKFQPEVSGVQYNYIKANDFDKYYKNDAGRIGANTKIRMAYLNVPLLLRYDIIPWVSVLAGPQVGVVFFRDENLRKDGVSAFKNAETSLIGGVQANLGICGIYGRFTQGLSNISNMGSRYKWESKHIDFGVAWRIK
ncbi:MAG: PorT family protein [Chitinophagaceae bacterium]|nr:PorT family protein [Chitinophagaceae bacterium]